MTGDYQDEQQTHHDILDMDQNPTFPASLGVGVEPGTTSGDTETIALTENAETTGVTV